MNKVSVVIPTLQKNKELFYNLISALDKDEAVSEIIVIDNSLEGVEHSSSKLKTIIPKENLYVNPSWNLGTKEAKEDIVALLNDDITIPCDFCKKVAEKIKPEFGAVGFNRDFIKVTEETLPPPKSTDITLEKVDGRCGHWGIAIFFNKKDYVEIPDELKIYCGDDWIFLQNRKQKKQNYYISGQTIYHFESLSCKEKSLNPIGDRDRKLYRKLTRKWWQFIFNIEPVFRGIRITVFGIEILKHFDKNH